MSAGGSSEPWRNAPESAHLQFVQLVGAVHLALEADFVRHLLGALAEDGRRHLVARLVDQVAREVLRLADDLAFARSFLERLYVGACRHENGEFIELLLFAVGMVVVVIGVGDDRAFRDSFHHLRQAATFEDQRCFVQRESASPPQFSGATIGDRFARLLQSAHSGSGDFAQIVGGEVLRFSAADDEQAFGLQALGFMEESWSRGGVR